MGMCQGCNKVFNVVAMKDGLCEECYTKEHGFSFKSANFSEDKTENTSSEPIAPMSQTSKNILIGIGASIVLGIIYFTYDSITHPSDDDVKNIASQMTGRPESKIEVVSSYNENGEVVMVMKIGQAICKMPMVKSSSEGWLGHGINCEGSLYDDF